MQRLRAMDLAQRQSLAMGKTQSLFNPRQIVFLCNERDKLVSELKHILHAKVFGGTPIFEGMCNFGTDIELTAESSKKPDKKQASSVRLFPTAIQVVTRQPTIPERIFFDKSRKSDDDQLVKPSFGTLPFSYIEAAE